MSRLQLELPSSLIIEAVRRSRTTLTAVIGTLTVALNSHNGKVLGADDLSDLSHVRESDPLNGIRTLKYNANRSVLHFFEHKMNRIG